MNNEKSETIVHYVSEQTRFIIRDADEKQSTIVHAPIKKGLEGLGLVVIQNGCFLQIITVIEDGPADKSGMLKPGDIIAKIGKTNVLGYKLRDLCDLIEKIPMKTEVEVTVYRNYLELPDDWENEIENLKSIVR
ncbi:PDZ domain-containing protein 9 [Callorhinchus milii]|uniref:PDZ domain-containing protein 9 n=1 Tax=Callorhinchus milii TaxID=7868 RepID=UPI0004575ED9|nr:PDZ domain-containing protein 9 [Callorhinchus milii]|eukprot:gi/632952416/ref/XP_007891839.1/ PREDICTED: PDZ domain-containing protein 9 [Callorhinchus milii]